MELKFDAHPVLQAVNDGLNRTFMELKYARARVRACRNFKSQSHLYGIEIQPNTSNVLARKSQSHLYGIEIAIVQSYLVC